MFKGKAPVADQSFPKDQIGKIMDYAKSQVKADGVALVTIQIKRDGVRVVAFEIKNKAHSAPSDIPTTPAAS